MKVILLDDEPLALRSLQTQLGKLEEMDIVGCFLNPVEALANIGRLRPDVAFVDIDMPQLNGLDAADRLRHLDPSIEVVFVSAYDEYAIKAFELNALDYLLKPVHPARLAMTVERLSIQLAYKERSAIAERTPDSRIVVKCCPTLNILDANEEPLGWRTAKAKELFAYMLYRRGHPVRKEALLELLWPDADEKKGYAQMYTTIYRIRKSLETSGIQIDLQNIGDGYLLHADNLAIDITDWEKRLRDAGDVSGANEPLHEAVFETYPGGYLAEHAYMWSESERQRLSNVRYLHGLKLCGHWAAEAQGKKAADAYERLLIEFPYAEEIYEALIALYEREGFPSLAQRKYEELEKMLREEYGEEP